AQSSTHRCQDFIHIKQNNYVHVPDFFYLNFIYVKNKDTRTMDDYKIPPQTHIGHVHLKVSDLNRALAFYRDLLGFELTTMYGDQAAFLSAGGYHHHIGLNTWHSKGQPPADPYAV